MAKSPSVILSERDASTYSITSSDTVLAVVGYATKGPIGKATSLASFKEFRNKFGYPTSIGYSSLAISKAFNQGNKVVFYRVAETSGSAAATASARIVKNNVDFLNGYTEFSRTSDVLGGAPGYYNSEVYDFRVGTKMFYLKSPVSGRWAISDILSQISNQIGTTSGYQEFGAKTIDNPTAGYYSFKLSVNGTPSLAAGREFAIDVTVDDTIETIRAKMAAAISGGARGYVQPIFYSGTEASPHLITDTLPGGMTAGTYNFDITLDGAVESPKTIVVNGLTAGVSTYGDVVSKINAVFTNLNINAVCVFNSAGFYFVSKTRSSNSSVTITLGTDRTSTGQGMPLFTTTDVNAIRIQSVGSSYNGAESREKVYPTTGYTCSINIDPSTLKIRTTSAASGSASSIIFTSGTIGNDLTVASFMGGLKTSKSGTDAASLTVEKNTLTKKIRISSLASTVAPTIEDVESILDDKRFVSFFGVDASVAGHQAQPVAVTDVIVLESKELGSSTKLISVVKASKVNPITSTTTHNVSIYYDNDLVETFEDLSLTTTDTNYFANVINDSVENGGSEWITVSAKDNSGNHIISFPDGTYNLGIASKSSDIAYVGTMSEEDYASYDYIIGTDGVPSSAGESLFVEALSSSGDLGNKDSFDFHILITPDNIEEATQNAAIELAEARKDFVYLVDPPFGLTYTQVKDWHNGSGYGRDTAVSSSYAAIYWPWLKDYDSYSKKYVWCPPSVFIAEKLMEVDKTYAPWYAPAGDTRGKIIASDVETVPSFAEREELYGDFNCVNPIVNFVAKGLTIYGQKTALRENKATNRLNVRRMVVKIKKLVKIALDSMLFEPNESDSWQKATDLINAILEPIKQDNGLSAYKVVIDGTLNTADVIAQSMMKGIIRLVPTGTIEIVEISLNIYKTGTSLD